MMSKAMARVEEWPERDLFDPDFREDWLAHEADSVAFDNSPDKI